MTKLSVNINKIATLRNSRGGNIPDLLKVAHDCEVFGADGITVHPRPDERHIRIKDVYDLKGRVKTEFNIEGYPSEDFIKLIKNIKPTQVTLVPDAPDTLTSNAGWNTKNNLHFLSEIVDDFKSIGIRTSIFVEADTEMVEYAAKAHADRVELYTGPYAELYNKNKEEAIAPYIEAAKVAKKLGLGVNAGHDLSLINLNYFFMNIPFTDEVSIGHALIGDALYLGLENAILSYKNCLKNE